MGARSMLLLDYRAAAEPDKGVLFLQGQPLTWLDEYIRDIKDFDPVPGLVRRTHRVATRQRAIDGLPDAQGKRLAAFLDDAGIGDFVVVPVTRAGTVIAGLGLHFDRTVPPALPALVAGQVGRPLFDSLERVAACQSTGKRPITHLSRREMECLQWVAEGRTSREIGVILGLEERTVHAHLARATRKLEASNRSQAVASALRLGLVR